MVALVKKDDSQGMDVSKSGWVESKRPMESWDLELSIPGIKYLFEKKTSKLHRYLKFECIDIPVDLNSVIVSWI